MSWWLHSDAGTVKFICISTKPNKRVKEDKDEEDKDEEDKDEEDKDVCDIV